MKRMTSHIENGEETMKRMTSYLEKENLVFHDERNFMEGFRISSPQFCLHLYISVP